MFRKSLALHDAVRAGASEQVRHLIAAGAAVNQVNQDGATPLHVACQLGQAECAQLLIGVGAAIDQAMPKGATPLHSACRHGHPECVQLLIVLNSESYSRKLSCGGCVPRPCGTSWAWPSPRRTGRRSRCAAALRSRGASFVT